MSAVEDIMTERDYLRGRAALLERELEAAREQIATTQRAHEELRQLYLAAIATIDRIGEHLREALAALGRPS